MSEFVTKPATILVVDGRQLRYKGYPYTMQCVAATTRRTRCRNPVETHGQVAKRDRQHRYRVDWEADDPFWLERYGSTQRLFATYRRQRCKTHVDSDAPDAVALQVRDMDTHVGVITTVVSDGSSGDGSLSLDCPVGVAVDAVGNVYIANMVNCRVLKHVPASH
ncbi:hypothetical protein [Nocardia testacea]|uniref:hypothetical protein n=1 Tax=Nocardia testacea TaxID=248551 RepID=UPI003A84A63D